MYVALQLKSLKVLAAKDYRPHQLHALLKSKSSQRSFLETVFVAETSVRTRPTCGGYPHLLDKSLLECKKTPTQTNKIVGFAALDRYTNSLAGLFIDPDYTRQGIGTQLLQKIEIEAVRLNIPILWVCASLTGYPFYKANNYQKINKTSISIDCTLIPCIQMKKRLLTHTKTITEVGYYISLFLLIAWFLFIIIVSI